MKPIETKCPRCQGLPTMRCRNDNGDELPYFHQMRLEAAKEASDEQRTEALSPQAG